jgi:hypothetical protein
MANFVASGNSWAVELPWAVEVELPTALPQADRINIDINNNGMMILLFMI